MTRRLAPALLLAMLAAGVLLADDKTRVAVVAKDDDLGKAVKDALIAAGARPVDLREDMDADAAPKRAKILASDGTADLLLLATTSVKESKESETGALVRLDVRITIVSGRSGEVVMNVTRTGKGSAGDVARATKKAKEQGTTEAIEGFKAEIDRVLKAREALGFSIVVEGISTEAWSLHGEAIERAIRGAGIEIHGKGLDGPRSVYSAQGSSSLAALDEVERALRKSWAKEGLGRHLRLVSAGLSLTYQWKDPTRTIAVRIENVNEETQKASGADLASALARVAGAAGCERTYDAATQVLVLEVKTAARLCDLDAALAAEGDGPLAGLRLLELNEGSLRYRFLSSVEPIAIEISGIDEQAMVTVCPRIDEAVKGVPRVSDIERTNDPRAATVQVKLRFLGKRHELETALIDRLVSTAGLASLVVAVPRPGVDLAYRVPGKSRTVVRLAHLSASEQRVAGQKFAEVVEGLEGAKVVDRSYDEKTETLELALESTASAADLESRIWRAAKSAPELARLGPGETNAERAGFVLLTEAAKDFGVTVVVSGLAGEAWNTDGQKILGAIKALEGTSQVDASYARDPRELTVKLRYRAPPSELEDALWKAFAGASFSRALAPDARIGSTVRLVFLERKGDRSRLFVRIAGGEKEVVEKFLAWLKTIEGVSEVEVHPGPVTEVALWSAKPPVAFYDVIALALAKDMSFASLKEGGLQANVVVVHGAVAKAAQPTTPPATGTAPAAAEQTPGAPVAPPGKLSELISKLDPGVVVITARTAAGGGLGTGFFVSPRGYVLTNFHVAGAPRGFRQADVQLQVKTVEGRLYDATFIDGNAELDLALIKIGGDKHPALALGDSEALRVGDPLLVIGNPRGLEHSACTGIVSGVDRSNGWIQTNALTNHGNSGGPVFDDQGRVVAVVVAGRVSRQGLEKGVEIPDPGLNFLIPINHAIPLLQVAGAKTTKDGK